MSASRIPWQSSYLSCRFLDVPGVSVLLALCRDHRKSYPLYRYLGF